MLEARLKNITRSEELYHRAERVMPGGNSRDSVYRAPFPYYAAKAQGCRITDVDGVERIDFLNNYTSLIHGHAHPQIIEAVGRQLPFGTAMAMPTESEIVLAELLCARVKSFERIRFVNSGSEAVMMALKAARAFTRRPKIAKIEGSYHGSYDYAEVSQTSSPERWGTDRPESLPVSRGTPNGVLEDVVVLPFNHVEASRQILDHHSTEIACVLVDLMPHRLGFLWCDPNYLEMLRTWTREKGALLVFDEVITLRLGFGGAQERYSQRPDLTSIAKIIGGGFPVGAVAGRADVMEVFNPALNEVPVPHGGTFNANPITMIAGAAAMSLLTRDRLGNIDKLGSSARRALTEALKIADVQGSITGDGSLFYIHFSRRDFSDYRSTYRSPIDRKRVTRLVDEMLDRGIVLGTTAMGCISTVMSTPEIDALAQAFLASLRALRRAGVFDPAWAG